MEHFFVMGPNGQEIVSYVPGRLHWFDIFLSRSLTANMEVWERRQQIVDGQPVRKNCSIRAIDLTGVQIAYWDITKAWPQKVSAPPADPTSSGLLFEELVLVHEGMERVE